MNSLFIYSEKNIGEGRILLIGVSCLLGLFFLSLKNVEFVNLNGIFQFLLFISQVFTCIPLRYEKIRKLELFSS